MFKDRLLHEGSARPLPLYYVIRFVNSPWNDEAAITEAIKSCLCATEYSFVDVMSPSGSKQQPQTDTENPDATISGTNATDAISTLSNVGIASNELWLLVKYSSHSFSSPVKLSGDDGMSENESAFLDDMDQCGGPIGSYGRLVYQVDYLAIYDTHL